MNAILLEKISGMQARIIELVGIENADACTQQIIASLESLDEAEASIWLEGRIEAACIQYNSRPKPDNLYHWGASHSDRHYRRGTTEVIDLSPVAGEPLKLFVDCDFYRRHMSRGRMQLFVRDGDVFANRADAQRLAHLIASERLSEFHSVRGKSSVGVLDLRYASLIIGFTSEMKIDAQHRHVNEQHELVGCVGKRGVGRLCFLDIDADGVVEQIERETGHTIPMTYAVQSSPAKKSYKRHYYFKQTQYSFTHFKKNFSRKDMTKTTLSRNNNVIHPEVYAVKGVGGGSYVVAAGCTRSDGEIYTVMHDVPVAPIPDWLIDWFVIDKKRQDSELVKEARNRRAVVAAMFPEERTVRQAKGDESAFEVSEANIIPFIQSRASSLGNLGLTLLDRKMLEEVLTGLVKQYCAGGVAYVESEHGRRHVHDVAFSKNLPTGSAKWVELMGTRKKAKLAGMIVSKVTRFSLLRAAVETFPARIGAERAYVHLQDALAGTKFTLGKGRAAERITKRLRDWAGYDTEKTSGGWCWVRRGRDAPAHQTTTVLQTTTQPIHTY